MGIRFIKTACTLNYAARKALEEKLGERLDWPSIRLDKQTGEVSLEMRNGKAEQLGLYYIEQDESSHEGRVVAVEVDRSVRIMSDVWADLTFVVVYEPTQEHTGLYSTETDWSAPRKEGEPYAQKPRGACGYFRRIQVGNSEFPGGTYELTSYKVDASPEIMEVYEAWKRGQAFRKAEGEYDSREYRRQEARRTVQTDKWVRVTRGNKVRKGTEGIVFWLGDSQWGTKVGIAIPQEDGTFRKVKKAGRYGKVFESYADVEWTYAKNCEVISGPGGRVL